MLAGLKGVVPAVRFSFGAFSMLGSEGLQELEGVLKAAGHLGFYVLLDLPEMLSPLAAERAAAQFQEADCRWSCDGLVIPSYLGSDILRPFASAIRETGKDLFVIARTANKSAAEVQDLVTGSRLVHTAVVDIVSRYGESLWDKCGYSRVAVVAAASAASSLRSLRGKYSRTFLLLDGYDYPNSNAKNCSFAFDRLGHGAAACAGTMVAAAWTEAEGDGREYVSAAVEAAERMKKNLTRYISVL